MDSLTSSLAMYSSTYDNYIIIGDFNVEVDDTTMLDFCNTFDLVSLMKEPTCHKNPKKLACIDLLLTNKLHSFQNS